MNIMIEKFRIFCLNYICFCQILKEILLKKRTLKGTPIFEVLCIVQIFYEISSFETKDVKMCVQNPYKNP